MPLGAADHAGRRRFGYVVQGGGLFPHLTAEGNAAIVARHLRWTPARIAARLTELAELTRLPRDALARFPHELSGGQAQRVSLVRALFLEPEVLLLDEPLGALDPITRADLQEDLRAIFAELGKTVVLVTHDLAEAAFFAHELVLLRAGVVVQEGSLDDLARAPADAFVARFVRAQRALALGGPAEAPPIAAAFAAAPATPDAAAARRARSLHRVARARRARGAARARRGRERRAPGALGGTRVVWEALVRGEVDLYPEYTGHARARDPGRRGPGGRPGGAAGGARRPRGRDLPAPSGSRTRTRSGCGAPRGAARPARVSDLARHPEPAARVQRTSSWIAVTAGPRCGRAIACRRATCAGSSTTSPTRRSPRARST